MTSKIIISDTSCLIALDRISKLEILPLLFPVIVTTKEVADEFGKQLPRWILISPVTNRKKQKELETILDIGEASAIALAIETKNCVLIIDEKKGRRLATELHIDIIGTLKILLLAKQKGIIGSVKDLIVQLEQSNFRFSKAIVKEILILAGEN